MRAITYRKLCKAEKHLAAARDELHAAWREEDADLKFKIRDIHTSIFDQMKNVTSMLDRAPRVKR